MTQITDEMVERALLEWYGDNDWKDVTSGRLPLEHMRRALTAALGAAPAAEAVTGRDAVIDEIAAERRRQVEQEGWTPEHDDAHRPGEIGRAAASYAVFASLHPGFRHDHVRAVWGSIPGMRSDVAALWPWSPEWFKPSNPRRELIKAAALIVAEIERLDRAATIPAPRPAVAEVGASVEAAEDPAHG